jgi:hypothetical protein
MHSQSSDRSNLQLENVIQRLRENDLRSLDARTLRALLVAVALEWEERCGVAPAITCAISEFDAAMLIGHTRESFAAHRKGQTAVAKGADFVFNGVRYQIKANRPSGKKGCKVTLVSKANNYDWDKLIWILYDRCFRIEEAWEWDSVAYHRDLDAKKRISPKEMRCGRRLEISAAFQ